MYFTADFHLGHANIIRYCNRPFANCAEMGEAILSRLNAQEKHGDHLYFLGDFCIGGAKAARAYLDRVRCKNIYLLQGTCTRSVACIYWTSSNTRTIIPSVLDEWKARCPFVRQASLVQPALQAWFARVLFANRTKTEPEVSFSFVSSRQVPQINQ
jgi:hypothetical protein